MSRIRPLEADDLPDVAALFEVVFGDGIRRVRPERVRYLSSMLLDHPWADPEIPSLVQLDAGGAIVGFIGSNVRRFRLDGRTLRAGCCAHFMSDPEAGATGLAALLLRKYLAGPQDLSFTDTATDTVRAMWERLGGETDHLRCLSWVKVLRPGALATTLLGDRYGRPRGARALRPIGSALDVLAARTWTRGPVGAADPGLQTEPLSPAALVRQVEDASGSFGLRPDYNEEFVQWLFAEVARDGRGQLRGCLVLDGRKAIGWFVYLLRQSGIGRVLEVCASGDDIGPVVDSLFHDADRAGAIAMEGRVEPALLEAVSRRRCLLRYVGGALIHSSDPTVLAAATAEDALMTRLEGEW